MLSILSDHAGFQPRPYNLQSHTALNSMYEEEQAAYIGQLRQLLSARSLGSVPCGNDYLATMAPDSPVKELCSPRRFPAIMRQESLEANFSSIPEFGGLSRFLQDSDSTDVYSSIDFRMYEFKVRRCMRGRSHDWTECPFAHPGEKARRRDPRKFNYSGTPCPDFRKGNCKKGEACEFAHGVFECWLHPMRYRTQPCKDGLNCKRRICFFAHTNEQLRLPPTAVAAQVGQLGKNIPIPLPSPTSALSPPHSPDLSPGSVSPRQPSSPVPRSPRSVHWAPSQGLASPARSPCSGRSPIPIGAPGSQFQMSRASRLERFNSMPAGSATSELVMSAAAMQQSRQLAALKAAEEILSASRLAQASSSPPTPTPGRAAMMSELMMGFQGLEIQHPDDAAASQWLQVQAVRAQHQEQIRLQQQQQQQQRLAQQIFEQQQQEAASFRNRRLESSLSLPVDSKWLAEAVEEERRLEQAERVVSGQGLRAEIYGKLGGNSGVEGMKAPDLSWVGDLVGDH